MRVETVLQIAKQIANTQGKLARSPCEIEEGGTAILCAAACIVRAAAELSAREGILIEFDSRMRDQDSGYLRSLATALDLEFDIDYIMDRNDQFHEDNRLRWFNQLGAHCLSPIKRLHDDPLVSRQH